MKSHIPQMMSQRFQTKQVTIHHVGQSCEWMPIGNVGSAKCPDHGIPVQTTRDLGALGDVIVIIEVDEAIGQSRRIHDCSNAGEEQADQN